MNQLEPLQVGVMFWTGGELGVEGTPFEIVQMVKGLGVACGQLGVHPEAVLTPAVVEAWSQALEELDFTITAVFPAFRGESYADIPTVQKTVGFVPPATREEREKRTYECSDFAKALGIAEVATHIGFVPEDRDHPDYLAVRDMVRRVCDHGRQNGQSFGLETGQESATALRNFIRDVDRANLGINFDPANMILYGSGEPLEALEIVKEWVISVHCKDALWPEEKGIWGTEVPLGQGDVDMGRYVGKLKGFGYRSPLSIEREITGEEQRANIREAIALLEHLRRSG